MYFIILLLGAKRFCITFCAIFRTKLLKINRILRRNGTYPFIYQDIQFVLLEEL